MDSGIWRVKSDVNASREQSWLIQNKNRQPAANVIQWWQKLTRVFGVHGEHSMNSLSTLFILGDSWVMLSLTEAVSVGIEAADRFFTGRGAKVRTISGLLGSIHKIFSIMWKWENTKMSIASQQTFLKKTHREVKSPHGFQSPSQQKQKRPIIEEVGMGWDEEQIFMSREEPSSLQSDNGKLLLKLTSLQRFGLMVVPLLLT